MARPRKLRGENGPPYSMEEFARKYGLEPDAAAPIFDKYGPSAIELDIMMTAKGLRPVDHEQHG